MQTEQQQRHRDGTSSVVKMLFLHRSAALTLLLVTLHQSIIASSAYFLTATIERFQQGADYVPCLLGYFTSMTLPFLPGCAALLTLQAWTNAAHAAFIGRASTSLYDQVGIYKNGSDREHVASVVSRNSFQVIGSYFSFLHESCSFALNSVLSLGVLVFLLPSALLAGYLVSFASSLVIIVALAPRLKRLAHQTEARHAAYGDLLGRLWDNTVLGNRYHFDGWTQARRSAGEGYYRAQLATTLWRQLGNALLGVTALLPTATLIFLSLRSGDLPPAVIAAIIVNLTRIFHILNSLGFLIYQLLEFGGMQARLSYLVDAVPAALRRDMPQHPAPRGAVFIDDRPVTSYREAVAFLAGQTTGRFTVRGENGAGKSTLLLALKAACGPGALLIPSALDRLHWRGDHAHLSTGQRMVECMEEALQDHAVAFLLLDEWDANLDAKNQALIDARLQDLSGRRVVVEIRH